MDGWKHYAQPKRTAKRCRTGRARTAGIAASSHLGSALLHLFGWGLLSANTVQWLAAAAVKDGLAHADMIALSRIGTSGKFTGNCRRDLLRKFMPAHRLPAPLWTNLTMISSKGPALFRHLIINPCQLIGYVWSQCRHRFEQLFGSDPAGFWARVPRGDPKFIALQRVMQGVPNWMSRTFPYILHGDAATYTTHNEDSILGVQMKGLLSVGFSVNILPIITVVKKACTKRAMHIIWRWIVHFLNALVRGFHSALDPFGRP